MTAMAAHLLAGGEHVRGASGDVAEQAVQGGQPLVAGAGLVAPVVLEVAQERHDPVEGEVVKGQAGDLAALVGRDEHQEQPHGVAVAAHRGGAQALDRDQVAGEEGVQDRAEGLGLGHRAAWVQAGAAKASNRRLAWSSSCGVIVR